MWLTVPDEFVKFRDPCLNRSAEIRPEAVGFGIFCRFSNFDKCRPEAASDVISSTFVGSVVLDKCAKFRDPDLCSTRSREFPPEAFRQCFAITSERN